MRTSSVIGLIAVAIAAVAAVGGVIVARAYAERPVVTSVSPAPGVPVNGTAPLRIVLRSPDQVQSARFRLDGADVTRTAQRTANGYALPLPPLDDGPHRVSIDIASSDLLGDTSTYAWSFTADRTAPPLAVDARKGWEASAAINGVSEPQAVVTAEWSTGRSSTTADQNGRFTLDPGVPDGSTPVTIVAADAAGNQTRAAETLHVDSGRPGVRIGGIDGWVRDTDHPKVYAFVDSASPTRMVAKVNGQDARITPMSIGYTIETSKLPQGTNTVSLDITNALGKTTTRTKRINVDSTDKLTNDLTLMPGARGADVARLTRRLKVQGFWKGKPSWRYNAKVVAAVKAFQRKSKLPEDGIARPELLARTAGKIIVIEHLFKLNLFIDGKLVKQYPVAVGQSAYPTPTGDYVVTEKIENPTWTPPNSPWAAGLEPIGPGVNNPLGTRWIGTTAPLVGIHGTPEDWTIGSAASHGCIRMHISDVEDLYPHVTVGMPVEIKP
ncbi:MAG: L,D-transpeptidase family protein [Gaiellales bacterium]